jgi:hypothetical protein
MSTISQRGFVKDNADLRQKMEAMFGAKNERGSRAVRGESTVSVNKPTDKAKYLGLINEIKSLESGTPGVFDESYFIDNGWTSNRKGRLVPTQPVTIYGKLDRFRKAHLEEHGWTPFDLMWVETPNEVTTEDGGTTRKGGVFAIMRLTDLIENADDDAQGEDESDEDDADDESDDADEDENPAE